MKATSPLISTPPVRSVPAAVELIPAGFYKATVGTQVAAQVPFDRLSVQYRVVPGRDGLSAPWVEGSYQEKVARIQERSSPTDPGSVLRTNAPLALDLKDMPRQGLLEYRIVLAGADVGVSPVGEPYGNPVPTNNIVLDLAHPAGKLATLPVSGSVAGAHGSAHFDTFNVGRGGQDPYDGTATLVYYGFTTATKDDYLSQKPTHWLDATLAPGNEALQPLLVVGDNGSPWFSPPSVWVPEGENLVWRVAAENSVRGRFETPEYFMPE